MTFMSGNETPSFSDKSTVPLGMVLSALLRTWGAMAILVGAAFTFGSKLSTLSEGQVVLNQTVHELKEDRAVRIRAYEDLQRQNAERLSSIETKVDILIRRIK